MSCIFFCHLHNTHRRRISISHPNDPSSSLSTDHPDHHGDATTRSSKYNTIISEDSQVHVMPVSLMPSLVYQLHIIIYCTFSVAVATIFFYPLVAMITMASGFPKLHERTAHSFTKIVISLSDLVKQACGGAYKIPFVSLLKFDIKSKLQSLYTT